MTMTGLESFDATVHKTNHWLHLLMNTMGEQRKRRAYDALRATLHALRDRCTIDEGAKFAAQLPMLVRGVYYEGWDPSSTPRKIRHKDDFLALIEREYPGAPDELERAAKAVFDVLENRVTEGEIEDVKHMLPGEVRELWPHH